MSYSAHHDKIMRSNFFLLKVTLVNSILFSQFSTEQRLTHKIH